MKSTQRMTMIDMKDIMEDITLLRDGCIYSDQFAELPKDTQYELYAYCLAHATWECCIENLKQMRYAVARIYFGI